MSLLVQLTLLMVVAQVSRAQLISDGACPTFQLVQDFDLRAYLGKWHGYSKYPQRNFARNSCSTVFYSYGTRDGGPTTIDVINRGLDEETGEYGRVVGAAVAPDAAVPTALIVSFQGQQRAGPTPTSPNYNIIGTDYDNFALVYSCRAARNKKLESLYVLTRDRQPSQEIVDQALAGIESQGIDTTRLVQNVQTDCPEVGPYD